MMRAHRALIPVFRFNGGVRVMLSRTYSNEFGSFYDTMKGAEHVAERQYLNRVEEDTVHHRLVEIELEIRAILVSAGETLTSDTVRSLAKLCLADELRA